ncbi:MAG: hypothetical protein KDG51_15045, partial [Calditrichaeota bacterium]|nr:hypothetical protein [Calditrichota bacterium]
LLMDGDKQLTARFRKLARFSLTVDTLGAGGVSWAPPGSVYDSASVVTLTAAPDSGYYFQGWSGDLSGNDNPLQMLMDANKSVAANFAELPDFTLTLDTIGGGGVALDPPGGIYDSTTIVTLTALPDSGYVFGGWSGDLGGSANPATLLLDADKNVTAIFIAQFQLVIDTVGAGAITVAPDTSGRIYDSLTVVTLSAAPAPGYYLSGWSGDLSGRDNPAVIIMNANKTVTGTFQQLPDFNLSTTVNGAGNITLNPPGGVYDSTTVVTLTATADSGYAFTGWSGDLSGLANPDSLLIDGHKSVTANFSPLQVLFTLTVDTSGSGSVQLNPPGGAYDSATVVTLTALPDSGFYFDGWSGDLSGPANPDSLVMDSSKSVTATFRELPDFVLTVTDSGPGTIVLDPPGGIYDSTTTVTVTAVPEYGATFLGWGGDLSGSTNPSTVIMDGNKQISAGFYKAPAYYTWNSGAGDWEDPTKWSPNGIPGPGDTAQVKNVQVTLNSDREVSVLILRAGGALGGGTTLTIRDSLQWTSGDMVDSGRTVIDTACIARISHGDNTIDLNLRTLENKGEVIWEGTGVWKLKNQANIYNRPGAVFDIRRDGILDFVKDLNGGNFINEGLLKKTAGTERVEFDPEFTNLAGGVVRASSGTLRFERGDATPSQGNFYADSGAVLQISERPFYADSVLFSGTGLFNLVDLVTLNVIGGGLVVDSFATLQLNTANLGSDGFLQGDGPLTVNGTFDWTLGTIQG